MGNKAWRFLAARSLVALFLLSLASPAVVWAESGSDHKRWCPKGKPSLPRCREPKPTLVLTASPDTIERGGASAISWEATDADACFASGRWIGRKSVSGSKEVSPKRSSLYRLTCFGEGGRASASVRIRVEKAAPPPAVDVCPNLDGIQTEVPSGHHLEDGKCIGNAPEPTDMCPNIDGIQETVPADHHIEDGECMPDEEPNTGPRLDHAVISEVYYDVDAAHGVENNGATGNEWIELYNPTDSPIDISGWTISDATASDVLPTDAPLIIPPRGFAVISPAASTTNAWSMPEGTLAIALRSAIGNGLANGGDAVTLKNRDATIDAMSYGSNTSVFSLPVPIPSDGHSFRRIDPNADTDAASDWEDADSPNPGE